MLSSDLCCGSDRGAVPPQTRRRNLVEIVQNGKHIATVDLSPRPACNQYSWLRVIRHFEPEMPCIISEPHLILSEIMKYLLKRYMIHITEDKKLLSALSE